MPGPYRARAAFTLTELLVSLAIVVLLLGLLLPMLIGARRTGYTALCANNLRQINAAWTAYLQDHKEVFPRSAEQPDWRYGGAAFLGEGRVPVLAADRPINRYIASDEVSAASPELTAVFRCAADLGVSLRGPTVRGARPPSVLAGRTCFEFFGTSYRANPYLLDSTLAGIDRLSRPLAMHELHSPSRVLLVADAAWYYATSPAEGHLEASWHGPRDTGNMLAADGSLRFVDFSKWSPGREGNEFALRPRPELGD